MKNIIVFVCAIFIFNACDYTYQQNEETPESKAIIYFSLGDATVNNTKVKIGQEIKDNDIIKTGHESYVEVKFGKQSGFRIREESEVLIHLKDAFSLDVKKGKVLNILEKKSRYSVRTPAAVAAVRGTIFFVAAMNADSSYFCACNGTISIENLDGTSLKQLSSSHHQANFCEENNGNPALSEAGMFEHTDLEIFEFMYRLDNALKNE
ncbi:MAG: FecR domain-containing protein [Calditrichae bacterium]|nr:FecR domain-containing protein [Calditrichia bacterium]